MPPKISRPWLVALAIVAIALPLIPYRFEVSAYVVQMFMQAVTYAIAVLGLVVVLGYTGQINLAQAAFFGLGAYGVALGTVTGGWSFWLSLAAGAAVATGAGLALGLTTIRLGGHYLAMITISFQQILDLVLVNWIEVTRGPDGVAGIPRPSLAGFELADDRAYLVFCAAVLYVVVFAVWWLPHTRLGRAMRSVRENELAAEVVGVHTLRTKVVAFSLSALLGAIGGGLYAGGFAYISPDNFNFARSVEFLTAVLLGGAQSPFGGVIGTLLIVQMPEWLKHLPESLRFIKDVYLAVYGIGVILIMVFLPEGIWGLIKAARARLARPADTTDTSGVAPLDFDVPGAAGGPVLRVKALSKHFGGLKAVDGIDIEVARGSVHALIGPNGSGKTTSLNVVSGIYRPTAGQVMLGEEDVSLLRPHQRAGRGMGRTFQNIRLFSTLSALENVMVGAQRDRNPIGRGNRALRARAMSALAFVGLADRAHVIVRNLPYGHQRLVEIARVLAGHPRLLLLDEPAAGLNQTEKMEFVDLLRRLRGHGLTIFLIDHDMGLVEKVSDRITVLNFGRKIAEGSPQEVLRNPDVIAAYLGTAGKVN
ncbi:MAG: ABC transporter permease subunit [Betaproteobacteria bacterium]|jgi:branched-chain amino acid transport system permease protein|nr:branched-chain amino acid ABC transporter ATP-binding protein/permease [Rhodocyclaceae bacterium]MCA3142558.1 branched-chain amino acid ABC transporter ATP-binding protein/permease [Rhodocyclaceae bacterium]MCE2897371.1 branched-chain amino acid ABC transporter ATP-binding protein/permease [Betaproteobacteria bacterium]